MSRRRLPRLLAVGPAVMALAACGAAQAPAPSSPAPSSAPAAAAAAAKPSSAVASKPAASAAASGAAKTLSAVKIGFAALSGNGTPVVVADDAGIFKKNGLPVERTHIAGSPNTIAALVANEVQFAVVGAAASVQAALGGADVVDVATLAPGLAFRFYSRPEIKTIADLKGKRVVQSNQGTDPDFALRLVLKKNGISYSDVQSVHVNESDAYVNEAYDYYVTGGIFPKELYVNEDGIQSLLDLVGETNPAAKSHKPADFIDNSFVKKLSA